MRKALLITLLVLLGAVNATAGPADPPTLPALPEPGQVVGISRFSVADIQKLPNPGNPPTGLIRLYADSTTGNLTCLTSTGGDCLTGGGGGGTAFNTLTSGTNTAAAMILGAGSTLTANGGTFFQGGVTSVSGDYTILATDNGKVISLNGGPGTITFPDPTTTGFGNGARFLIENTSSNSFTLSGIFGTSNLGPGGGYLLASNGATYSFITFNSAIGAITTKTTNYTPTAADNGAFLEFNGTNLTLTLTNPIIGGGGQVYFVENWNSTLLTIDPNGLTIDGSAASITLGQNQGIVIASDVGFGNHYYTMRGNSSDLTAVAPVFNAVRGYGAVGDGSTSNNTAMTNIATAVNALTQGTVNTQKVTPARVYFPGPSNGGGSKYNWSNTPNFTQPVELSCDQGVVLNYTGSGHAIDFGPSGLTSGTIQSGIYSVHGCTFTGGASMTEGLFFNKFIVEIRVYENSFRNFGNATGATVDVRPYALWFDGDNYGTEVHDNTDWNDDNVARNFLRIKDNGDGNSQLAAYDNELANINGASGTACSSSSGIGFYVDGYASSVSNNNFACGWAPGIWVGAHAAFSTIQNNYAEVNTGGTGCFIQYGDPSTGSPSTFTDSLTVKQRYLNLHSNTSAFLLCPSTSSAGLVNSYVEAPALSNYPANREVVQLNNTVGQTNNIFGRVASSTALTFPFLIKTNVTTTGSNIATWTQVGNVSTGQLNSAYDNFNRANGGLGANWTTITSLAAPQIVTNQIATSGSAQAAFWNANAFGPNQFSQFTVTTAASGSNFTEAWVRVQSNAQTAYACAAANNAADGIYKFVATAATAISSLGAINFSVGDVFRCEANGSTITFYKNGVSVATATDTVITFGAPGIDLSVGASIDNWSGGNLQPIAQLTTEQDWTQLQHFSKAITVGPTAPIAGTLSLAVYAPLMILEGATSGLATITPQSVAGTPTLTLPNASGTFAVNASSPLALDATTGALTCATCVTSAAALTNHALVIGSAGTQASKTIAAGTSGQVVVSQGASADPTTIDYPDVKFIPAANCNNATAGNGWSIGSGGTVTCRAGTNNLGGFVSITDTSSTFATFQVEIPEDWDSSSNPFIRFQLASTDATNNHTIIPSIQVACYKGDGSTTDDVAANAAHSLSTTTLNGNANRFWSGSSVQMNSTDVTGCVAGALMQVTVGRATDTATNAEFYGATITFPRLLTVQAN